MASEPLVKDPIAFEWGPDGKLWVVEMGDYPLGLETTQQLLIRTAVDVIWQTCRVFVLHP